MIWFLANLSVMSKRYKVHGAQILDDFERCEAKMRKISASCGTFGKVPSTIRVGGRGRGDLTIFILSPLRDDTQPCRAIVVGINLAR